MAKSKRSPSSTQRTQAGRTRATAGGVMAPARPATGTNGQSSRLEAIRARAGQRPSGRAPQRRKVAQPWYKGPAAIWGSLVTVVVVFAIILLVANRPASGGGEFGPTSPTVLQQVTGVPAETFAKVGSGGVQMMMKGTPANTQVWKDASGKPIVFYAGADYCPYCAAERWSIIVALSRFGTWSNLHDMASMEGDTPPSVPTFTFNGATYTSQYITFIGRETADRNGHETYTLSGDEKKVFDTYNASPYTDQKGAIPFVDIANQYVNTGAGYPVQVLTGQTRDSIAAKLSNPDDLITQSIVGNANYLTAAICQVTQNQPANVCTQAPIPDLQKKLPSRS